MFSWIQKGKIELLEVFNCPQTNIKAFFSSRKGGFSRDKYKGLNLGLHNGDNKKNVLKNRNIFASELGFNIKDFTAGEQVHGSNVYIVHSDDRGRGAKNYQDSISGVDALITAENNLPLISFYADCVPLYFIDRIQGVMALAHAGWKGTVKKIGIKTIKAMQYNFDCSIKNIYAAVGPCISGNNYQVNQKVIDSFRENFSDNLCNEFIVKKGLDRYLLDLRQANNISFQEYGLSRNQIYISKLCTFDEKEMFYSYRRDKKVTGRMCSVIYKKT